MVSPITTKNKPPRRLTKSPLGFTLIELMLVVAILGLLAAIAVPKMANMITKAKEAAIRGHLGAVRGAIRLYYAATDGCDGIAHGTIHVNHQTVGSMIAPAYIDAIPVISIPTVPDHTPSNYSLGTIQDWPNVVGFIRAYRSGLCNDPTAYIMCTHLDSSGRIWSTN